jgi:signal transduction histidine kinase
MLRFGLFEQLFWRVLAIVGVALGVQIVMSHATFIEQLYAPWQADLQQQAEWTARHWQPGDDPKQLASAWQESHHVVRLSILGSDGATLADSQTGTAPLRLDDASLHQRLVGRVALPMAGGTGTLLLTRAGGPVVFDVIEQQMGLAVLTIVLLAALVFYPMVRALKRQFGALTTLARQVADGRFGAKLDNTRQRDLAPLVQAFNDMSQRLHDEDERKRRLIIDVSHELRSPMARLRALGETITRLPHEAAPFLLQLEAEIALMDRLVGDMLDATRVAEGRSALVLERCLLSAWVADAFTRQRRRIEEAGVRCETRIADSAREADIDPQRLMQTLSNLVENALQATRGQASPLIAMSFDVSACGWTLAVSDNGRGIAADELPRVFDRFYRIERDRGRLTGGVGLGLSIAKAIVEGHGGRITISSTPGHGTQVQQAFG